MGQEAIEHWASEFLSSTPGEMAVQRVGERTGLLLVQFLQGACGWQNVNGEAAWIRS